jgi:hypothetical protein
MEEGIMMTGSKLVSTVEYKRISETAISEIVVSEIKL